MNFRRFSKYICVLSLATACTVTTMAATITDVANNHWAYSAVLDLADRGIMVPTSKGEFKPNQLMNYFEVASVLAKATGYVDIDVAPNVDAEFKAQIKSNYEKQKPILATYAAKYSTWDKSYDKQVAYLLGRGYINTSDLDKFITKVNKSEIRTIMTKDELSVLAVRLLGKENTAKTAYKTTGFADEKSIKESYRPHVAYLKSLGLINGTGNFNPSTKVTKALCAKMLDDALVYKEKTQGNGTNSGSNSSSNNNSNTETQTPASEMVTVNRVLTKNTSEYYVSLVRNANTSYYTIKATTKVTDASGKQVNITSIPTGARAKVTIELQDGTEYITSLQLMEASSNQTPPTDTSSNQGSSSTMVSGKIVGSVNNDVLRLTTAEGSVKTYLLQEGCQITLNGATVTADQLSEGDTVTLTVTNTSMITKIVATKGTSSQVASNGELTAKKLTTNGYVVTLKQNNNEATVTIPETAKIQRNNKTVDIQEVRIGDTIKVTRTNGEVTLVEATGTRQTVTGTIQEVHLAQTPKVMVKVNNEIITYIVSDDAELYDSSIRKYVGVRDLHLGQEVSIIADSREMISLDIEDKDSSVKLMGTIKNISRNNDYIDVFVGYDPMTGDNKVYKRVNISSDTTIVKNDKTQSRNVLKEDMEVLIIYKYLDDRLPQKIQII